jgi:hypothetical protein
MRDASKTLSGIAQPENDYTIHSASFRDPAGFVLTNGRQVRRVITQSYQKQYEYLLGSGLCEKLIYNDLIIPFKEVDDDKDYVEQQYKVIEPETIPFISYPSEWSFEQLKEAALVTLDIQLLAMEQGMCLKDASSFNMQMHRGKMMHIDTLSFEFYDGKSPWVAYGQFCEHFLAPLLVLKYCDTRLNKLLSNSVAGLPLDLAVKLLPFKAFLKPAVFSHLWLHSKMQSRFSSQGTAQAAQSKKISQAQLTALLKQLRGLIQQLQLPHFRTEWGDYYSEHNYSDEALQTKMELVQEQVKRQNPELVLELGGNNGHFSRFIKDDCKTIVCADIDYSAVQSNCYINKAEDVENIIPVVLNIAEPTPAIGLGLAERDSFLDRAKFDMVIALAVMHHLVITCDIPMQRLATLMSRMGEKLVIEYVPDCYEQIKKITVSRPLNPQLYNVALFEGAFSEVFTIKSKMPIADSGRTLYYMEAK